MMVVVDVMEILTTGVLKMGLLPVFLSVPIILEVILVGKTQFGLETAVHFVLNVVTVVLNN